jgi:hypothetical protein
MSGLVTPWGTKVPARAQLPRVDLRLVDGRSLKLQGPGPAPNSLWWQTPNGLRVLASMDETPQWGRLLHVSMSYRSHDPSWDDIKAVRDVFFPDDIDVMMVLPKREDYVNIHRHTFHLWQTPTEWGLQ